MDPLAPLFLWYGASAVVLVFFVFRAFRKVRAWLRAMALHRRLMQSDAKYQLLNYRQVDASASTSWTYKAAARVYLLDRLLEEGTLSGEEHRTATQRAWAGVRRGEPPRRS